VAKSRKTRKRCSPRQPNSPATVRPRQTRRHQKNLLRRPRRRIRRLPTRPLRKGCESCSDSKYGCTFRFGWLLFRRSSANPPPNLSRAVFSKGTCALQKIRSVLHLPVRSLAQLLAIQEIGRRKRLVPDQGAKQRKNLLLTHFVLRDRENDKV